ncbi:amidophosphoribosyltransferase [Methanolobus halotolerans]|uniref:Amidophosphoribosyltransferase n=1 Tax=Methanolobus halotolerans TaxID=2052935 RepID=A0A4E0PTY6_9EURY|nr:amidophosphoribosyltransferase [Methanolobus halotolerans]TGC08357.1 amidophosphoribosyltransferase [Methanolobus halotolerans]
MREECGVVGVVKYGDESHPVPAALQMYYAMYALQHRGQESSGITVYDGKEAHSIKGMGLVPEVYKKNDLLGLKGKVGIGHVRYSTTGDSRIENCQPFIVKYKSGSVAIAHNGNLINGPELRKKLETEGHIFVASSDTEVIAHLLVKELLKYDSVVAISNVMKQLNGSYSLTILIDDVLIAVRDPFGFKPLCIGTIDSGYVVASESVAIDTLNGELLRDVKPGELVMFLDGDIESHQLFHEVNSAHCVFEYIYFARPDSIIDGRLVYKVRERIGERLAKDYPVDADMVSPVPDSGITSAIGYARESNIDYEESLMKNRYIGRTFILPGQAMRETAVRLKMNTIAENIKDKSIILIDDSVVRGTTSRRIIDMIKKAGAREVHARIGSPPIVAPCYLGIDMASRDELIAAHKTTKGVEAVINADSLGYLSIEGLVDSIGFDRDDLCIGCLTGAYPVDIPGEKMCNRRQLKIHEFQ